MTRKPGGASKDLQRRVFGTVGHERGAGRAPTVCGRVIDLSEEILGRPIVVPVARAWKPRPGRVYNFLLRNEPDGK